MKKLRRELKEIIKNNPFKYIAVRGTDEPLKIGQILETSYRWDYAMDCSSQEELGGVCAINLTDENQWNDWIETDEETEEIIDEIEEKIEASKELYKYNYNYIIISTERNPLGYEENDDDEIILADAVVVAEI